jgi:hypothetical protein
MGQDQGVLELQQLIRRYIIQFRYGCQNLACNTASCYTSRKRRLQPRPSVAKARMMAYAVADSDDPFNKLCPNQPHILPQDLNKPANFYVNPLDLLTQTESRAVPRQRTGRDMDGAEKQSEGPILEDLESAKPVHLHPDISIGTPEAFQDFISHNRLGLPEEVKDSGSIGQQMFSHPLFAAFENTILNENGTLGLDGSLPNISFQSRKSVIKLRTPKFWLRQSTVGLSSEPLFISKHLVKPDNIARDGYEDSSIMPGSKQIQIDVTVCSLKQLADLKSSLQAKMDSFQPLQRSWMQLDGPTKKKVKTLVRNCLGSVKSIKQLLTTANEMSPFEALAWSKLNPFLVIEAVTQSLDELLSITPDDNQSKLISDKDAQRVLALSFTLLAALTAGDCPKSMLVLVVQLMDLAASRVSLYRLDWSSSAWEAFSVIEKQSVFDFIDALTDDAMLKLASKIVTTLAVRQSWCEKRNGDKVSFGNGLRLQLKNLLDSSKRTHPTEIGEEYLLVLDLVEGWLKNLFMRSWNGNSILDRKSVAGASLSFLDVLEITSPSDATTMTRHWFEDLEVEQVESFLDHEENPQTVHVVSLRNVYPDEIAMVFFRILNYRQLFDSYRDATFVREFGERVLMQPYPEVVEMGRTRLATQAAPLLQLRIRREHLLEDAMAQLWKRQPRELKRPLKIDMVQESGVDQGGVSQEFFRLVFAKLFEPETGLFVTNETSGTAWLRGDSNAPRSLYELFGILMGIGVHNGLLLPVSFPEYFYAKLQGEDINGLESLRDGWPDLYNSYKSILLFNETEESGSIEDTFGLDTTVTGAEHGLNVEYDYEHGGYQAVQLGTGSKEDPIVAGEYDPLPVTAENRHKYITRQVFWLLRGSISGQWADFERGFFSVMDRKFISILKPKTFKSIVEGENDFNVAELESRTTYYGEGFKDHRVVQWFWEVLKSYPQELRKRFLMFTFGTDKVAGHGLGYVKFTLEPYSGGEYPPSANEAEALPTVSSCFGILRLPDYKSKEVLDKKLKMALENCEGFGMA